MSCSVCVYELCFPFLFQEHKLSTLLFGALQTWRVNLKALEISKQIQWPFYGDSGNPGDTSSEKPKVSTYDIQVF